MHIWDVLHEGLLTCDRRWQWVSWTAFPLPDYVIRRWGRYPSSWKRSSLLTAPMPPHQSCRIWMNLPYLNVWERLIRKVGGSRIFCPAWVESLPVFEADPQAKVLLHLEELKRRKRRSFLSQGSDNSKNHMALLQLCSGSDQNAWMWDTDDI